MTIRISCEARNAIEIPLEWSNDDEDGRLNHTPYNYNHNLIFTIRTRALNSLLTAAMDQNAE